MAAQTDFADTPETRPRVTWLLVLAVLAVRRHGPCARRMSGRRHDDLSGTV